MANWLVTVKKKAQCEVQVSGPTEDAAIERAIEALKPFGLELVPEDVTVELVQNDG